MNTAGEPSATYRLVKVWAGVEHPSFSFSNLGSFRDKQVLPKAQYPTFSISEMVIAQNGENQNRSVKPPASLLL
jgi:hypothetical protein